MYLYHDQEFHIVKKLFCDKRVNINIIKTKTKFVIPFKLNLENFELKLINSLSEIHKDKNRI